MLSARTNQEKTSLLVNQFHSMSIYQQYPTLIELMYNAKVMGSTFKPVNRASSSSSSYSGNSGGFSGDDSFYRTSGLKEIFIPLIADCGGNVSVLDVGGGNGGAGTALRKWAPNQVQYECIDVFSPNGVCASYSGKDLSMYGDASKDIVMFHYVLHHSHDGQPISLLREALRVTRAYVIVGEDMAGENPEHSLRNFFHETVGLFRGPDEWRQIFELIGFVIHKEISARWDAQCPDSLYYADPTAVTKDALAFWCKTDVRHRMWALKISSKGKKKML